jgi:hypothetical protein
MGVPDPEIADGVAPDSERTLDAPAFRIPRIG